MKISKLFHWLYGILMLLPCFAILVKCAYVAFNKNAYESYSGTSTQYIQKTLQTNEVNSVDDLIDGNVYCLYYFNQYQIETYNSYHSWNEDFFDDEWIDGHTLFYLDVYISAGEISDFYYNLYGTPRNFIHFNLAYDNFDINFFDIENDKFLPISITLDNTIEENTFFIFQYFDMSSSLLNNNALLNYIKECPQEYLQYTTYYEEVEVSTLDNVFYYAVDEVCNNDLFAWASNSFLNAPLTYITNLFNMPSDSALILLMSYWFNISVIWLVFDVMIYVPLLVHRWLDKGIVE